MEKVLFAADELSRPVRRAGLQCSAPKATKDMELKSLKKKFKDKKFGRRLLPGCDPSGCGAVGLGAGHTAGPDPAGHAGYRIADQRRHGNPVKNTGTALIPVPVYKE